MRSRLFALLTLLVFVALSVPGLAAEGRMPVWQPRAIGPGQEGHYIVTRDITGGAAAPVIDILPGTVAVEIDLNGFTLYGGGSDVIRGVGIDSVVIRNGTIINGGVGIRVEDCRKVVIEDVKIQLSGRQGIFLLAVSDFAVRRNIVLGAALEGILADGTGAPGHMQGVVEDNLVQESDAGIAVINNHSSVAIQRNRVQDIINLDGIRVQFGNTTTIAENNVAGSGAAGIVVQNMGACSISGNTCSGNTGNGIEVITASTCQIRDNVSSQNSGNGLYLGNGANYNHIEKNTLSGNTFAGIWLGPGSQANSVGRNSAGLNVLLPGPCAVPPPGPGCFAPNYCDDGAGNKSFGDNLMPGPPTC